MWSREERALQRVESMARRLMHVERDQADGAFTIGPDPRAGLTSTARRERHPGLMVACRHPNVKEKHMDSSNAGRQGTFRGTPLPSITPMIRARTWRNKSLTTALHTVKSRVLYFHRQAAAAPTLSWAWYFASLSKQKRVQLDLVLERAHALGLPVGRVGMSARDRTASDSWNIPTDMRATVESAHVQARQDARHYRAMANQTHGDELVLLRTLAEIEERFATAVVQEYRRHGGLGKIGAERLAMPSTGEVDQLGARQAA